MVRKLATGRDRTPPSPLRCSGGPMTAPKRKFRTQDSIDGEAVARDAIITFLRARGYSVTDHRTVAGSAIHQVVTITGFERQPIKARVRLCWRRTGSQPRERLYSAAQLRARLIGKDWDRTLAFIQEQDVKEGVTHTLIAQHDGERFIHAALIPRDALMPIWQRQRDVSARLIADRQMGRIKTNVAMKGQSPAIWLQDDRTPFAHAVADALWTWPGVVNLNSSRDDDTYDDCPVEAEAVGRDLGTKVEQIRSGFRRDPRVRAEVLKRANGCCEREGCGARRDFPGFLDVHHILGIGTSDRVWNCVAVCPSCHRDAHFSPNRDAINEELRAYSMSFGKEDQS